LVSCLSKVGAVEGVLGIFAATAVITLPTTEPTSLVAYT